MKILVVDDVSVNRKILVRILEPYAQCTQAEDGQEAVEIFTQALIDQEPFDLILLDIMMPNKDGLEALLEIRSIEKMEKFQSNTPAKIVFISALDSPFNKTSLSSDVVSKAGFDGHMVKPIRKPQLIEKLRELGLID